MAYTQAKKNKEAREPTSTAVSRPSLFLLAWIYVSVDMCYCLIAPRGDGGRLDMVENVTRLNMAGGIQSPRGAMKAAAFFLYRLQMSTKGLHPSQNKQGRKGAYQHGSFRSILICFGLDICSLSIVAMLFPMFLLQFLLRFAIPLVLLVCNGPVSYVLRSVASDRHQQQVRSSGIQPSYDSPSCKGIGG